MKKGLASSWNFRLRAGLEDRSVWEMAGKNLQTISHIKGLSRPSMENDFWKVIPVQLPRAVEPDEDPQ